MFATAIRELRHHPARYIATILAVAISVGFMAAASVITATEQQAIGHQQTLQYGNADIVVKVTVPQNEVVPEWSSDLTDKLAAALAAVPGVDAAEPITTVTEIIRQEGGAESGVTFGSDQLVISSLPSVTFRSAGLVNGEWPVAVGELAVSEAWAKSKGLKVSDSVTAAFTGETLRIVGFTDEPSTLTGSTGYVTQETLSLMGVTLDFPLRDWRIKLSPDSTLPVGDVMADLKEAVAEFSLEATVSTHAEVLASAVTGMVGDVDAFKYVLWVFAGIAMVVGMITISNTFTILLTQRRRQIGLMRAIGASGTQVRLSVLAEAVLLGLVGSVVGVLLAVGLAAAVGLYTGSLHFGIALPFSDIALAVGIGTLVTVAASVLPTLRATRVAPIEALLPTETAVYARKVSWIRGAICSALTLLGLTSAWMAFNDSANPLVLAILGAALITFGVLFGAPLFVPAILRIIGLMTRPFGATAKLAAANSVRNPARASATATALMLAVGLVFTIQVGSASMRETVLGKIDAEMPVDFMVSTIRGQDIFEGELQGIPEATQTRMGAVSGVKGIAAVDCVSVHSDGFLYDQSMPVCAYAPALGQVVRAATSTMPDDEIWVMPDSMRALAQTVTLAGPGGTRTLRVVESAIAMGEISLVSPATAASLGTLTPACVLFVSITDRGQAINIASALTDILNTTGGSGYTLSGAALQGAMIESILDILMMVLTGLLGVAVLVALVGVSNTLTLSVIERTRESAMLRALGLQKSSLRWMMLVEAVLVVLVGALVGLVAGMGFGWLGSKAVIAQLLGEGLVLEGKFAVDWALTLGLLGILALAAALASVLPGRRAANATVVEALAVD